MNGGTNPQAIVLAVGQLLVTAAFTGVTLYLLATRQPVPAELWTLNVGIVSYFIGQRVPFGPKPTA